ncbi:tetratricopeptide repeat protein [Porphyromonas gulae]|uniref:hypothetical protein n=1 Tax=Porphyromonas gulae TaxID=111105 RepID=UPI00052E2186|nr:hypothetical protein [Porphyromonas gulae]KGN73835.1 tetratricopeptide repeat protein [Porphyromonas gulae]KGO04772.1 tetratricopeptide repeat protein [Porphyromonas gulae]
MLKKIFSVLLVCSAAVVISSCSGKLRPVTADLVKAEPQPLEVVGSKVPVTVNIAFPAKWFNKKAELTVKPVLRYATGESWGPSFRFQGEKVLGNERVVSYDNGGNQQLVFSFPYKPAMDKSELFLTFEAQIKGKKIHLPDLKVADGVISTEALASALNASAAIAPDVFQRIIKQAYDANIMFLIQQAQIRAQEINKGEVRDWKDLVANAKDAPNQNVTVEVQAYASPDGGVELNKKLSEQREKNTTTALKQQFQKSKIKDVEINAHYTAQDWEGFKQLVEKSDIQDKELVLRVLSMYPDPEQREQEIKNISTVFRQLADDILPQLRRSRLIANVEIIGKSDDEIKRLAAQNPGRLTVEELLYSATLLESPAQKEDIYKVATQIYPNDYRAYNNIGMMRYRSGDLEGARTWFQKAASVKPNAETDMNLGLLALNEGNVEQAKQYFGSAANVPELGEALGLLYLQEGNYAQAVAAFGKTESNNAAVANILNRDYNRAQEILNGIKNPDATTYYLMAVVAARTNNLDGVVNSLRESISLDSNMMKKVATDLEFAKYANDGGFKSLLRR